MRRRAREAAESGRRERGERGAGGARERADDAGLTMKTIIEGSSRLALVD